MTLAVPAPLNGRWEPFAYSPVGERFLTYSSVLLIILSAPEGLVGTHRRILAFSRVFGCFLGYLAAGYLEGLGGRRTRRASPLARRVWCGIAVSPGQDGVQRSMELTAVAGTCMGTELQSTHRRHYVRRQYRHSGRMSSLSLPCSIPCLPSS